MKTRLAFILALLILLWPPAARAQDFVVIRDAEIEETLKTFTAPIFDKAGLSPDTVRIILLQKNELNAFVAGGQNIFINTGLILETSAPEELIGVLAHESGHIAAGHLFRTQEVIDNLTLQTLLANILGVAVAAGAQSGDVGMAIGSAGQSLTERAILRHSRIQETSADQAGVRFLKESHLPISGFLSFMEKLSSQELLPESQQSEYVRTHPMTRDRVDFLQNAVDSQKDPGSVPPGWNALHARMKAKLLGFLFPDRALQNKGDDANARYARAIATYRKGKSAEALALLEPLIKEEPKNPYFQELKGQILFESGRVQESTAPYARAVTLAPKSGLIRAAYGHALLEAGKPGNLQEAVRQLQLSLATEPRQSQTHHFLAMAYGKQGNEGLSRLHLAEEALMQSKTDFAKTEALLAKKLLPRDSAGWQRADDILDLIGKKRKKND